MKNPIYAGMALVACAYLALSNARGWSWLYFANPARWTPGGARFHHK
jgi:hypothetical protein